MMGELISLAASRQALTMEEEVTFYDVSTCGRSRLRFVGTSLPYEKSNLQWPVYEKKERRQYDVLARL